MGMPWNFGCAFFLELFVDEPFGEYDVQRLTFVFGEMWQDSWKIGLLRSLKCGHHCLAREQVAEVKVNLTEVHKLWIMASWHEGGGRCWNVRRQPAKLREIWCPPPVTSWFTLPLTIDIIPVNPSDWSYVHELSKLWGTTQHEQNSQEAGSIQVSPDLVETTSPYCSSMMIVKFSMCFCSRVICHHVISWTGWLCVRLISSGITHTPQSRKYRI